MYVVCSVSASATLKTFCVGSVHCHKLPCLIVSEVSLRVLRRWSGMKPMEKKLS